MIRRVWHALGRFLRALDGCSNPKYKPREITEDPDQPGYLMAGGPGYSGAAPDFGPTNGPGDPDPLDAARIAQAGWDDDEFERWRSNP